MPKAGFGGTLGWDLVYAVRADALNARIARQFGASRVVEMEGLQGSARVTLDAWKILPGGGGPHVLLAIPVSEAQVLLINEQQYSVSGELRLSVELEYLAEGVTDDSLVLRVKPPMISADDQAAFSLIDFVTDTPANPVALACFQSLVHSWFKKNPKVFAEALAVIDLAAFTEDSPYNWLLPTSVEYSMTPANTVHDAVLCVLVMTQKRTPAGLDYLVSNAVVAPRADGAVLMSPRLVLHNVLLNALPKTFPGLKVEHFRIDDTEMALTLIERRQLEPFEQDGKTYQPTVEAFSMTFNGGQIECKLQTSIPVFDGVTAFSSIQTIHGISISAPDTAAEQALAFTELAPPVVEHWDTTDPTVDTIHEVVGGIIIGSAIVASFFTAGLTSVFVAAGGALIGGVVGSIPAFIAAWAPDTAPVVDLVAANVAKPFRWMGSRAFQITDADLVDCLRFNGTPWPLEARADGG